MSPKYPLKRLSKAKERNNYPQFIWDISAEKPTFIGLILPPFLLRF
jgi:hypothetical protein